MVGPCQISTFFIHGIGSSLTSPIRAYTIPLPVSLGGISAIYGTFKPDTAVPILSVDPMTTCTDTSGCSSFTAVTVQIPYEIPYDPVDSSPGALPKGGADLRFAENGTTVASLYVYASPDQLHLVRQCDLMVEKRETGCRPSVTHASGDLVTYDNPAKSGEQVVLYGVGLGQTFPPIVTGLPVNAPARVGGVTVSFDFRPNSPRSRPPLGSQAPADLPVFSGLTPGFQGLYQINVVIPTLPLGTPACNINLPFYQRIQTNLTINVGRSASFDGAAICVVPGP